MIDPKQVTNFHRSTAELEEFLLFAILVAGKKSEQMAPKLEAFLKDGTGTPLEHIRRLGPKLEEQLRLIRMGQYGRIAQSFRSLAESELDLSTCAVEDLEAIPGIGPKTARFFLLHTRKDVDVAALDTHILKFLRSLGHPAPKKTPRGAKYRRLEKIFIDVAKSRNTTVAQLDLEVWTSYAIA